MEVVTVVDNISILIVGLDAGLDDEPALLLGVAQVCLTASELLRHFVQVESQVLV